MRRSKTPSYLVPALVGTLLNFGGAWAEESKPPSSIPAPAKQEEKKVSKLEARRLRVEFHKAQLAESKALKHRHSLEIQELEASQVARQREWERREKESWQKFLLENTSLKDRQSYRKGVNSRRRILREVLAEEREARHKEQRARQTAMDKEHKENRAEFMRFLDRSEEPPNRLWPKY